MKRAPSPPRYPSRPRRSSPNFSDYSEIEPYTGDLYRPPDSDLRTAVIADGRLLVIWLVLDDQDQVEVVRIIWSGNDF